MMLDRAAIFSAAEFDQTLTAVKQPLPLFRKALKDGREVIRQYHLAHGHAPDVVAALAELVDQLVIRAWQWHSHLLPDPRDAALVAVGGYGRGELHPASDVDLMILLRHDDHDPVIPFVERLLQFLWDMGLEVGHSLRSLKDCVREAKNDITVVTNIMEARLLVGDPHLFEKMQSVTSAARIWPSRKFFAAKWQEQIERHHQFHDTAYNLEPNVKEGPGGLRDIQMIMWVARRHFNIQKPEDLIKLKLLSKDEHGALEQNRNFLWQVRNSLHFLSGRREDRLLFDYQRAIAKEFGYRDKEGSLAVEQLMKRYYRTIKELSLLNEILLQLFQETILARGTPKPKTINKHFRTYDGFIGAASDKLFENHSSAMLEMFLIMQQQPQIKGVRAHTLRLLRANLHRIDAEFRKDETNRNLFMEILRQPQGQTHALRRMNAYGVLGAYIPVFGKIVGQMQHDLFHVYTVDEHSLFVLRNLRRFTVPQFQHEFPRASGLIRQLAKPERLYLAALFHDIAKGRGGDHSVLGEKDAIKFCRLHGMSDYDSQFVGWLVRNHLLMSWTAQRKDIADPEVITEFARQVGDQERLNNLYLLTMADIRGTSPKVWNDWKGHLLAQLYAATSRVFSHGIEALADLGEHVDALRNGAQEILRADSGTRKLVHQFWTHQDDSYFLRYDADSLAWHADTISHSSAAEFPLVATRYNPAIDGSEFLIYTPDREDLFVILTAGLDLLNLNIIDARVNTTRNGFALDTFAVLDYKGKPIKDTKALAQMENAIREQLARPREGRSLHTTHLSRQLRHFPIETQVNFTNTPNNKFTVMEITAQDRPGLLHQVALALRACKAWLVAAKIFTHGERAEDVFFITDREGKPVTSSHQQSCLQEEIYTRLNIRSEDEKGPKAIRI